MKFGLEQEIKVVSIDGDLMTVDVGGYIAQVPFVEGTRVGCTILRSIVTNRLSTKQVVSMR